MASFKPIALLSLALLTAITVVHFDQRSKADFDAISPVYTDMTPASAPTASRPSA
ncbi:MAG: hypothetical protein HKN70_14100 [Gammaproteobacteria bacterium]|nr:hypothetical protein [Gammaproteobacteria bacterium]